MCKLPNFRKVELTVLALLTAGFCSCGSNPHKTLENIADCGRDTCPEGDPGELPPKPANEYPEFALTLEPFADCSALQQNTTTRLEASRRRASVWNAYFEKMSRYRTSQNKVGSVSAQADSAAPSPSSSSAEGGGGSTITNTQEKGIDEADFVKAGTRSLFVARGNQIEVLDRASLQLRGTIKISDTPINAENLFVDDDQLVVISSSMDTRKTLIKIFSRDVADAVAIPTVTRELTYEGSLADVRLASGHLILILNDQLPIARPDDLEPNAPVSQKPIVQTDEARIANIPCNQIIRPSIADEDWRLTKVISVNTKNPEATPYETAFLGSGDKIYMGQNSLYVAKVGFQWSWGYPEDDFERYSRSWETLAITRVDFNKQTGAILPVAIGTVVGRVKDQWAFKEFPDNNGTLAVATSTGELWSRDESRKAQNHLYVLQAEQGALRQISAIHDFGTGEDIRSVRYVDRTAYVVTFKKTDPLYAFDLSDLANPKKLGELKIPGFSTYMHPVADGRLLGVGFDAEDHGEFAWFGGIKISLFDTSNPTQISQLDSKNIGTRGSISDATGDHHGFFFDAQRSLVGLPVIEVEGGSGGDFGNQVAFAGAVLYKLVDDRIVEVARISHDDLTPDRCRNFVGFSWWETKSRSYDINRLYNIDNRLVSVSRFGVKAYAMDNLTQALVTTRFSNLDNEKLDHLDICQSYPRWD